MREGQFIETMVVEVMAVVARHVMCGQTAAFLAGTCRAMRERVRRVPRLTMLMMYHVLVTDDLARTLAVTPGAVLAVSGASQKTVDATIATLFWYRFGVNIFLLLDMLDYPGSFVPIPTLTEWKCELPLRSLRSCTTNDIVDRLCLAMGIQYDQHEGGVQSVDDHGNVMIASNHYGSNPGRFRDGYVSLDILARDIPNVRRLEEFRDRVFPGVFDWRLIHFPFVPGPRLVIMGGEFHRATSMQYVFRSTYATNRKLASALRAACKTQTKVCHLEYECKLPKTSKRRRIVPTKDGYPVEDGTWNRVHEPIPNAEYHMMRSICLARSATKNGA